MHVYKKIVCVNNAVYINVWQTKLCEILPTIIIDLNLKYDSRYPTKFSQQYSFCQSLI